MLFTKNGLEYPQWSFKTLKLTDEYTLSILNSMKVGNVVTLKGVALKRVK